MTTQSWPRRIPAANPAAKPPRSEFDVIQDLIDALKERYQEQLFLQDGKLVFMPASVGSLVDMTVPYLDVLCADAVVIQKLGTPPKFEQPTERLLRGVLAIAVQWAPPLNAFVDGPSLTQDGRVVTAPGYDEVSGYYNRYTGPEISEDVPDAMVSGVLDKILGWFPFADDASMANALGLFLLPIVHPAISGPTPAHLIVSHREGMGKTDLAVAAIIAGYGKKPAQTPPSPDPYTLGSLLANKPSFLMFDNVPTDTRLGHAELYNILTTEEWGGRLVGQGRASSTRVRALWVFTGNRVECTPEMARRTVEIRFSSVGEKEARKRWLAHGSVKPPVWVEQHRAIVLAVLVKIVRSWVDAGRKSSERRLPSFEAWADIIGGIVQHYSNEWGRAWLANETMSAEARGWATVIERWPREKGSVGAFGWLPSGDVLKLFEQHDSVDDVIPPERQKGKLNMVMGRILKSLATEEVIVCKDAIEGVSWRLSTAHDTSGNQAVYRPERVGRPKATETEEPLETDESKIH